jgi:hypothetical protein
MTDEITEPTADEFIGISSDLIIDKYGTPKRAETIGKDVNGLIVEWYYGKFKLTFARAVGEEPIKQHVVSLYVVTQVEFIKEKKKDGRKRHKSKE